MYKTLSTMLPFDKVGVDSADQPTKNAAFYSVGESMSNPKTIERDDTARKISLSLEMKHFLSLLIATKGEPSALF